jgi:hypothetical protein
MLKIVDKNGNISYKLTESERVSLVSDEAKSLISERLHNLDKFINSNIDFFTEKEVKETDKWYFTVFSNGQAYDCIYDNEHEPEKIIEKEAKLLMWRHGFNSFSYVEVVGDYIEDGKVYKPTDEVIYNDCLDYLNCNDRDATEFYEEIELNEINTDEVKDWLLSI